MSTCLDIVRRALRKVAGEAGVPDGQEGADALQLLQSVILDLPGLLRQGEWTDTYITANYTAADGDRITATVDATVSLPESITVDSLVQQPADLSRVNIVGAGLYIYSASKSAWSRADELELSDDVPFGPEDDEGLACLLAIALVDEYGGEVSAATVGKAARQEASFRARFYREVNVRADESVLRGSDIGRGSVFGAWLRQPATDAAAAVANYGGSFEPQLDFSKPENSGYLAVLLGAQQ